MKAVLLEFELWISNSQLANGFSPNPRKASLTFGPGVEENQNSRIDRKAIESSSRFHVHAQPVLADQRVHAAGHLHHDRTVLHLGDVGEPRVQVVEVEHTVHVLVV